MLVCMIFHARSAAHEVDGMWIALAQSAMPVRGHGCRRISVMVEGRGRLPDERR